MSGAPDPWGEGTGKTSTPGLSYEWSAPNQNTSEAARRKEDGDPVRSETGRSRTEEESSVNESHDPGEGRVGYGSGNRATDTDRTGLDLTVRQRLRKTEGEVQEDRVGKRGVAGTTVGPTTKVTAATEAREGERDGEGDTEGGRRRWRSDAGVGQG